MISFEHLSIRLGSQLLIDDATGVIHKGQKIGITGRNGSGKSTLFSLISGNIEPEAGNIFVPNGLQIARVKQETPNDDTSALEYALRGDAELTELRQALAIAEQNQDGAALSDIHEQLIAIDGHSANSRAAQLLHGLGFAPEQHDLPVNSFSGGWRMRLNLAQALMCRSDILLLDEPTNHLDMHTVVWLEHWLQRYPGTLLLISHDRDFLDACVNHILHIEQRSMTAYTGNYSSFERQRAQQQEQQQAQWEKQQREREHMQAFVNRFKAKATKAKQAQSRIKALERMEQIDPIQQDSGFTFKFHKGKQLPHILLELRQVGFAYGEHAILNKADMQLTSGDRIGLIGANGAGKSTLIKILAGALAPSSGSFEVTTGVKVGYFSQHQLEGLNPKASPLEHMLELAPKERETALRGHLGAFGFHNDRVHEAIQHFSGGERSRLALALLVYQQPDILLLDEPTNHLDITMREALASALSGFHGALVIVSHDSYMLKKVTRNLYLVANQAVTPYTGSLHNYITGIADGNPSGSQQGNSVNNGKKSRDVRKKIGKLEKSITNLQKQKENIEQSLADPELYTMEQNNTNVRELQQQRQSIIDSIETNEQEWFALQEKLET